MEKNLLVLKKLDKWSLMVLKEKKLLTWWQISITCVTPPPLSTNQLNSEDKGESQAVLLFLKFIQFL